MNEIRKPRDLEYDKELQDIILKRMLLGVNPMLDRSIGSFTYDILAPVSIETTLLHDRYDETMKKFDIYNLKGEELDKKIWEYVGIKRKPATYASGTVVIIGEVGALIEEGTLVSKKNTDVKYKILEDKEIDESGMAEVVVECEVSGSVGNAVPGSVTEFPVTVAGLTSVNNIEDIGNGYDAETDKEFLKRYEQRRQRPAKAGNKYHYEQWAMEVPGVGKVKVHPRTPEILDVTVIVVDKEGQPASEELQDDVFQHIEKERPFGANVYIKGGTPIEIFVKCKLKLRPGYILLEVKKEIEKNIEERLKDLAFETEYVSYARVGGIVIATEGVLDYEDLTVNGGKENILIGENEVAVLGGVDVE